VVCSPPVTRLRLHGHKMAQEEAHGHGPISDRIGREPQLESVRCSGTKGRGRRIWVAEESEVVLKEEPDDLDVSSNVSSDVSFGVSFGISFQASTESLESFPDLLAESLLELVELLEASEALA
jgi:hypothetical protein